jgi:hypothetical protein
MCFGDKRHFDNIYEARETAEMLVNYWDCKDHEQTEYYLGVFNALTWVLRPGSELFGDDETAVLSEE